LFILKISLIPPTFKHGFGGENLKKKKAIKTVFQTAKILVILNRVKRKKGGQKKNRHGRKNQNPERSG
jgi:hypothetical protein